MTTHKNCLSTARERLAAVAGCVSVPILVSAIVLSAYPRSAGAQAMPRETTQPLGSPTTLPTLRALCVGAGTFADKRLRPIPQAANDASAVAAALTAQRGRGLYSDVDVHVVSGKEATRGRVLHEIAYLRDHAHVGDVTVVYLCGYETADDDARARFLTADIAVDDMENTAPLLSDVHELLLDLPKGHALVLLDLNHGDAVPAPPRHDRLAARDTDGKPRLHKRQYDPGLTTSDLPSTVRMLYSATGREPGVDAVSGHSPAIGVFAETVSEALSGRSAAADPNAAAITAGDLCRFVETRVSQIANDKQHPYVPFAADPFDDFPLATAEH